MPATVHAKPKRRDVGISERHARSCPARDGGRCCCSPTWQAQVWDARAGKRITRSFATITAARQWRQDASSALRAGTLTADRGPTLEQAACDWLACVRAGTARNRSGERYKPAAVRGYERNLRLRVLPELGRARLSDLRLVDLQRWVDRMARSGLDPATLRSTVTPLRAILRRAEQLGQVQGNPTRGLTLPASRSRRERFATPREAEALLAELDPGDRALWATALYAGLRRGELVALRWTDVDLAEGVIDVRRGWDAEVGEVEPKSRNGRRRVPIPGVLRDYLVERRLGTDPRGRVFESDWHVRRITERARARWEAKGLAPLNLHEARHSYASLMIAAGVNAKALSRWMGHANIGVTFDLYGHLMPGSEAEGAALLGAYLARSAEPQEGPGLPPPRTAARTAAQSRRPSRRRPARRSCLPPKSRWQRGIAPRRPASWRSRVAGPGPCPRRSGRSSRPGTTSPAGSPWSGRRGRRGP
jgi:integrase